MSKPALGRGLGELMGGQKPASPAAPAPVPETEPGPEASTPGLGALLRGKQEMSNPFAQSSIPPKPPVTWLLLKWCFVVADVLMLVPTSFFVLTKKAPLTFLEGALCVITFAFAACLVCVALLIHQYEKRK